LFRGKRQARKAAEAQRDAEQAARIAALANRPDTVCPFLGMAAARADFSPTPHQEHRCYAFGDAAVLSNEQQARVCLQRGYGNCPRYLRGLLVIPTEEMEAIRRRKADFPTDVVRDTPRPPVVAPAPVAAVQAPAPAHSAPRAVPPRERVVAAPLVQAQAQAPAPAAPVVARTAVAATARVPAPTTAAAVLEMPAPIRIARVARRPAPAARRSRRWRTATLLVAASVLVLALASATGLFALNRLEGAAVAEPTPSPVATRAADPTASARPTRTPRPTARPRPTRTPRPTPTPTPTATPTATPRAVETWTYVVADYDSISAIAQRYGSTTETLLDLNPQYRDNPNFVVEGDRVVVPCTEIAVREGRCP